MANDKDFSQEKRYDILQEMQVPHASMKPCLSVVMPVYNEQATIEAAILAVLSQPLVAELICVDDGSNDNTRPILEQIKKREARVTVLVHKKNQGKGAALKSGIKAASFPYLIVQDADLEYSPDEYPKMLQPILQGKADAVIGSRFIGSEAHRVLYFWHSVGNRFLTLLSNMCTNLNLTDMETCYKVFKTEFIQKIHIEENRFGFEPEIVAKLARSGARIYEVAVSYNGRTYLEGKKISWKDGLSAIRCILKYSLFSR